ncbi:hypothetical protein [Methylococcus sp. Mc7]|uniref:hypothetical protein n=1 Tax=Methylococcus sp. Mc7 TaxID=2860258 RepID=UPI001C52E526|nr:hypothetical protein [Methylococcus sp. Mc7]QXP85831.1 hypothetical protein KW115_09100 [Methylococcus sp. Mc7]
MKPLFLAFVAAVVVMLAAAIVRYVPRNYQAHSLIGLLVWVTYGGLLGYGGVIGNTALRPPGLFYLLMPIVLFVMFMARSRAGAAIALSFPAWLLMGAESLRLVVEVFLHQLWIDGQIPKMMTFHGANFDIVIGLSAPVVAWLFASRRISNRTALAWNVLGIAMLANVVSRGVLTTPGPLQLISTEVPNAAIGTFPFTFIPGLMVPLALVLHVLSIRALRNRSATAVPAR